MANEVNAGLQLELDQKLWALGRSLPQPFLLQPHGHSGSCPLPPATVPLQSWDFWVCFCGALEAGGGSQAPMPLTSRTPVGGEARGQNMHLPPPTRPSRAQLGCFRTEPDVFLLGVIRCEHSETIFRALTL